jgi:hypothetical protein
MWIKLQVFRFIKQIGGIINIRRIFTLLGFLSDKENFLKETFLV